MERPTVNQQRGLGMLRCLSCLIPYALCAVSASVLPAWPALANQPVLTVDDFSARTVAEGNIFISLQPGDEDYDIDGDSESLEASDFPYSRTANAQTSLEGASTSASASMSVGGSVDEFGATFSVQGSGSATADRGDLFIGGQRSVYAAGVHSFGGQIFSPCVPVLVEMTGSMTLNGSGSISYGGGGQGDTVVVTDPNGSGSLTVSVNHTIMPDPSVGVHSSFGVSFGSFARIENNDFDSISSSVMVNVTISITALGTNCEENGEEAEVYFWEALNGAFNDESNWEPEGVPGAGDLAIFDKEQNYTVSFGQEESGRAWVERGFVSFEGGSYDLGGGSQENPSLIVGNDSEDSANLFLGTELSTTFATLGRGANMRGSVRVGPSEYPNLINSGRWTNQGRLVIGQAGIGLLSVEGAGAGVPNQPTPVLFSSDEVIMAMDPDSKGDLTVLASGTLTSPPVAVGNMALGIHGIGTLTLQESAMSSGEVVMGVEPAGGGIVNVTNGSWQAERFVVGRRGTGIFSTEEFGGLVVESNLENIIGEEAGSVGSIALSGAASIATMPVLTVGKAGAGVFVVDDSASLLSNHLRLGREATGEGRVLVLQGGILGVSGEPGTVIIGDGSTGVNSLELEPGSQGFAKSVLVGVTAGEETNLLRLEGAGLDIEDALVIGGQQPLASGFPSGALVLQRVGIIETGELIVNSGGEVLGSGVIELTGGNPALVTGAISPGVVVFMTGDFKEDGPIPAYGRGQDFGALTIAGSVWVEGGVIDLSIGGDAPGMYDVLIVEGDATLEGVTVVLNFVNGYGPEAGVTLPLIEVTGESMTEIVELLYTGLADGFDYSIEEEDGLLVFRALNNGVAMTEPFEGEEEEEEADPPVPGCFGAGTRGASLGAGDGLLLVMLVLGLGVFGRRTGTGLRSLGPSDK